MLLLSVLFAILLCTAASAMLLLSVLFAILLCTAASAMLLLSVVFAIVLCTTASGVEQCMQCNNARSVQECTTTVNCSAGQMGKFKECYTEEVVTSFGIIYNAGCRDAHMCSLSSRRRRTAHVHVTCSACCHGNIRDTSGWHCNTYLCGLPGTSRSGVPGYARCYTCDRVADPRDCTTSAVCKQDMMCSVETTTVSWAGHDLPVYSAGCRPKDICLNETQLILHQRDGTAVGKRQLSAHCSACCGDDCCNNNECLEVINKLWDLWKSGHFDISTLKYIRDQA